MEDRHEFQQKYYCSALYPLLILNKTTHVPILSPQLLKDLSLSSGSSASGKNFRKFSFGCMIRFFSSVGLPIVFLVTVVYFFPGYIRGHFRIKHMCYCPWFGR